MDSRAAACVAVVFIGWVASAGTTAQLMAGVPQAPPAGIAAEGWHGSVDRDLAPQAEPPTIDSTSFVPDDDGFRIATGPAAVYWNPSRAVTGDFVAGATFTESRQTSDHPHPYGLFIGGQHLGTDQAAVLYCVAYGDGTFLVRQIVGSTVTTLSAKSPHASVRGRDHLDAPVTQKIAWSVRDGQASCAINDAVVWTTAVSELTRQDGLETTDGLVGLRIGQGTQVLVSEFVIH